MSTSDTGQQRSVLIVDDDSTIAELVQELLADEGYHVSSLPHVQREPILAAIGRIEPDCLLLDSSAGASYGASWELATDLTHRARHVPVVMFTAHAVASDEAAAGESARSQAAGFSGVVSKPFDVELLLAAVAKAVSESILFDRSPAADLARTRVLVEQLQEKGATRIGAVSSLREWVVARAPSGALIQLYWWDADGVYYVSRYINGGSLELLGKYTDRDAAIARAVVA